MCLSENIFILVTKELLKISCSFESSFQLPSLCTAGVSLDCQAQHELVVKPAVRQSQEDMALDVWDQRSTELTRISLGCGQRGPDRSLCFQTRQRFHSTLGEHSLLHLAPILSKSLLKTDLTASNKHQRLRFTIVLPTRTNLRLK